MSPTIQLRLDPRAACRRLRADHTTALLLDGGDADGGWTAGPLLAVEPRVVDEVPASGTPAQVLAGLERVARRWRERQGAGGGNGTGLALLLSYEALDVGIAPGDLIATPRLLALEVDASLRWQGPERIAWTACGEGTHALRRTQDRLGSAGSGPELGAAQAVGRPATSLPRSRYLAAVERLGRHIRDGDVYQANLCRVLYGPYRGDELGAYERLVEATPAPRSAFLATPELAVVSASPEVFLEIQPPDRIATWPIKGTRPRGADAAADRASREELAASEKDRAELLMIIDLERNDLGRVCRTGSIEASAQPELRSFPAVHHLVARVSGRLRDDVSLGEIVVATFPGGSISGAPKERARSLLADLEPVRRGLFTGSLFWLGDDGSLDSSILIRTLVFRRGLFHLGAGGGIVADSVADLEWSEANHKARALARALGFAPEDAG